jgi:hypothetical protein
MASLVLPGGAATGIGSLPGTDIVEAQRIVLGELPDLPHLPELPARGPGADMIGRGAAFLVDLPVELYAARWRVASRGGRDLRVARDFLDRDLDTLTEQASEYEGLVKIQAVGPWTLAASLDLPVGGALLHDPGAARDLAGSLAEGLRAHVQNVRARLPHATVLLQLDEPSLPAVLAGHIPTESGFGVLRPVENTTARDALGELITAVDAPVVVHCCAADVPFAVLREAGAAAVSIDLSLVTDLDGLGEWLDAGLGLFAGVQAAAPATMAESIRGVWRKLGFPLEQMSGQVIVTPPCGLAGTAQSQVVKVLTACREAAHQLVG